MITTIRKKFQLCLVLFLTMISFSYHVKSDPIFGGKLLVAETSEVIAEYFGGTAGYFNSLYLLDGLSKMPIFDKATEIGQKASLGTFTAGTELIFGIYVRDTGHDYLSGAAERNPDNMVHAMFETFLGAGNAAHTKVGFEDLWKLGDGDFDDVRFTLSYLPSVLPVVAAAPAQLPLPNILLLFVSALLSLSYIVRQRDTTSLSFNASFKP